MTKKLLVSIAVVGGLLTALAPASCTREPDKSTYFQRTIAPVLQTSCVRTNTGAGCHVQADDKGNALGNLDVSTFDNLSRRRDLLLNYGPYGQPAMLAKVVPPFQLQVQLFDGTQVNVTTDIKHAGGPIFDPTATAYQTLRKWMDNGASENNTGQQDQVTKTRTPCAPDPGFAADFNPNVDPMPAPPAPSDDYKKFVDTVNPVLKSSCAAGNCHGTAANELYLTCGDTDQQKRWNYYAAVNYLAKTPEQSELARRPLSSAQGGAYHEGGAVFQNADDSNYKAIVNWAAYHGAPDFGSLDPTFLFFAKRVQPVLARKGCMMVQCHSAAMFHDYRLRGGSSGSFSLSATKKNYDLSLQQIAIESENPNASRLIRKNLFRPIVPNGNGVTHRGGSLFEDFKNAQGQNVPADLSLCQMGMYDYDNGDLDKIPAYCVVAEWIKRERDRLKPAPMSAIVYVRKPISNNSDRPQEFDTFNGGAELRMIDATIAPNGDVTTANDRAVTSCGLNGADIGRPSVSWDGKKIAFAARASAQEPWAIYEMDATGMNCAKHAEINAGAPSQNGILIHNFDPAYSPPDQNGVVRLVFASTRGLIMATQNFDYAGPTRAPADPSRPNSNLYVFEPDPNNQGKNRVRQLTFQLNMERYPSFMLDGRVIFTTEKRAPHFYELALRRINLDGGDYHPLYSQRASIGYHEATQVVELADKNFATIFSEPSIPHQGGTLGVFNRSIGIDFTSSDPKDYILDPGVINPAAPQSVNPLFFLHSLHIADPSVSGKAPEAAAYRSPATLPSTRMLVSYGMGNDFDVYSLEPSSGQKTRLFGAPGVMDVDAVAVYGRASHGVFRSRLDEPNGHTVVKEGDTNAEILVLDVPMIASLVFQNTPTGRPIETGLKSFDVYEDLPPEPSVTSFANGGQFVAMDEFGQLYVRRRLLGTVPLYADNSAKFKLPGGVPIVLSLGPSDQSKAAPLPRTQREAMSFYPGEYSHQSFQAKFFNGLCGQCHGATTGKQVDVAVRPDIITGASQIQARDQFPTDLNKAPGSRGPIIGPML